MQHVLHFCKKTVIRHGKMKARGIPPEVGEDERTEIGIRRAKIVKVICVTN